MTDNHPTAARLTAEQIEIIRSFLLPKQSDTEGHALCDMALASLARPVPSDMAADVELVREAMTDFFNCLECTSTTDNQQFKEAKKALDRIVAHLSPRDAAPSDEVEALYQEMRRMLYVYDKPHVIKKIQQALDQARAEGLERAAKTLDGGKMNLGTNADHVLSIAAHVIRALIPAGQP